MAQAVHKPTLDRNLCLRGLDFVFGVNVVHLGADWDQSFGTEKQDAKLE
jgi:hypothetical protein